MRLCRLLTSFKKAWKVTVVDVISRRSTPETVLSRIFLNSASKTANCIIVDIVNYFIFITGKLFATHF